MYFLQRQSHWNRAGRVDTESESTLGRVGVEVGVLKQWSLHLYSSHFIKSPSPFCILLIYELKSHWMAHSLGPKATWVHNNTNSYLPHVTPYFNIIIFN